MQNKITFVCKNERREAIFEGRRRIFDLLSETNFGQTTLDFPCGGKKSCGKCQVKIIDGFEFVSAPDETEMKLSGGAENIRYACMCEVFGDVTVELDPRAGQGQMEISTMGRSSKNIEPNRFKKITATLTPPTLENPISREKNLISALGADLQNLPFHLIKKLSEIKGQNIEAIFCDDAIIDLREAGECADIYGVAADIGSTTVALYLYSLTDGNCLGVAAAENPQRAYGADVISRINYTIENPEGLNKLKDLILSLTFGLIRDLCEQNNINQNDVYSLVLTGNTIMQHIASGLPPKSIAFTPFSAESLFGFTMSLAELSNGAATINQNAQIYFPPALASYVGGDIATGIIASGTDLCDEQRLFLDVGTNGEIGLGNKDKLVFCATAAGPAFEGAHIALGMAGVPGAIDNIYLDELGQIICKTIGNKAPIGICGSGIIDAVALMCELGVVDETGRLLECDEEEDMPEKYRNFAKNLCEIDGENAFVLDKEHNIYITHKDIREIQLAKAAVSAGIMTLLHYCDKTISDIGELVLAGGFGAHIDKKSACRIGLIPAELEDKVQIAGNTAGMGAAAVLLDHTAADRIKNLSKISEYIELSGDAFFMDEYVERMMF